MPQMNCMAKCSTVLRGRTFGMHESRMELTASECESSQRQAICAGIFLGEFLGSRWGRGMARSYGLSPLRIRR